MPLIAVKKLDERAVLPTYGSEFAAGADLYALADGEIVFQPGETKVVRTGLAMEIPEGYAGLIYARSGLACKRGLAPANKVGVVDSDYRGEVMVALHNHSTVEQKISAGVTSAGAGVFGSDGASERDVYFYDAARGLC